MTDNDLCIWPGRQDIRIAELEAKLHRLELARQELIKCINQCRTDAPHRGGMVHALRLWSEARG